jgi:transcriptional regulator with XRE-family HTH domain
MHFQTLEKIDIGLRIKWLREERKMSMRELALKAGIAVSYISKLEAGRASPTVVSLQKLLNAMNMDVYEFFRLPQETDVSDQIVFKRSGMATSEDEDRIWYYAFPKHPDINMELTYEEYQPHTKVVEKESYKGAICGIVLSGELTLEVINQGSYKAKTGDAFYVKAGRLHSGRNDGDETLRIVAVLQQ